MQQFFLSPGQLLRITRVLALPKKYIRRRFSCLFSSVCRNSCIADKARNQGSDLCLWHRGTLLGHIPCFMVECWPRRSLPPDSGVF